jgi:hypothetical protein
MPPPPPPPPHTMFTKDITATYGNNITDDNSYQNEAGDMEMKDVIQEQLKDILYWQFSYNWDGVFMYSSIERP